MPNVFTQLQRELGRFRDDGNGRIATSEWDSAMVIKKEGKRSVIHADITGVNPEDINVSMEKDVLTIKGENKAILRMPFFGRTVGDKIATNVGCC